MSKPFLWIEKNINSRIFHHLQTHIMGIFPFKVYSYYTTYVVHLVVLVKRIFVGIFEEVWLIQ